MPSPIVLFWKQAPFTRFLLPLMCGILIQWYCQPQPALWWIILAAGIVLLFTFFSTSQFRRYRFSWLSGVYISALLVSFGGLLTWYNDIRHNPHWFGHASEGTFVMEVTLDEPLIEKTKSFKANATVTSIFSEGHKRSTQGKIIVYFQKDSSLPLLDYGSCVIFRKPVQEIKNSGNPGAFDYKRYALFNGITHQVFLTPSEFEVLPERKTSVFQRLFYPAQEAVLSILRENIKGQKELGLAEALLIGYKNDLDKSLVQSYSNTGVVHVIAISGLHIGLIYWLLDLLLKPLAGRRNFRWLRFLVIVGGLWAFSLLAGGSPSVLRSAVMFTCIVLGQSFSRRASIYNTLSLSAFLLLCFNPYWLWDVGFQLSYIAVLSIVIFMKPVYNLFFIKNKWLDALWKLNAVTLAAQILTLPLTVYYFHQFPLSFFLSNVVAVPLSSLVVLAEILLCTLSFIPEMALWTGKVITYAIWFMNYYIGIIEHLPASVWSQLQIDGWQSLFLFGFIAGLACWLIEGIKIGTLYALVCLLGFAVFRSVSFIVAQRQQKMIVYNVPQHQAIDLIDGRHYFFIGDSSLLTDEAARNFHLGPSRTLHRVSANYRLNGFFTDSCFLSYKGKRIFFLRKTTLFSATAERQEIDLLVVSGNPKLYIAKLLNSFVVKQVVFDGSANRRRLVYWKKDCDSLHIPYHDVSEKGAFVINFN